MPFQSVPNCAEAVVRGLVGGKEVVMVLNAQAPFGYDQDAIDALATAVDAWMGETLLTALGNQYTYLTTTTRGLQDIIDLFGIAADSAGAGGQTSNCLPNNAALCITHLTGATGRSARGRSYVPGLPVVHQFDSTHMETAYCGVVADHFDALRSALTDAGWAFVIISRFSGGLRRPFGVTRFVTDSVARNNTIDSQRNRLIRR